MTQQKKVSKSEKELQNDQLLNKQINQYNQFKRRVKMETEDSDMRINWLSNKVKLKKLEEEVEGIKNIELALIKQVLDTVIQKLIIPDKTKELYDIYGIEIPIVSTKPEKVEAE